jgi:thioredoxin-related protein
MRKLFKVAIILVFIFKSALLIAQNDGGIFNYGEFVENSDVYLFADNVNIREKPSTAAKVIANLPVATQVKIISKTKEKFIVNGYNTCWYEINFKKDGKIKTGFIWGGFLSVVTFQVKGKTGEDVMFVYGITDFTDEKGFNSALKAVVKGKIVKSIGFPPMDTFSEKGEYYYNISGKVAGDKGLKNIEKMIFLSFLYPACGYVNGDIVIFWTGSDLIFGVEAPHVSEAGVFHFETELIFPDDEGGMDGYVIKKVNNESYDEEGNISEKSTKIFKLIWDGQKLAEQKTE